MNAKDLMIGDWVDIRLPDDGPEEHMYSQVEQLWECEIDADFETSYDNVYPIPLTREILEKNGFGFIDTSNGEYSSICIGEGFYIELSEDTFWLVDNCIDGGDYGYESNWIIEVKYVHELQHALKLCGIEKEIVL